MPTCTHQRAAETLNAVGGSVVRQRGLFWEYPNCRKNCGKAKPGHLLTLGNCKSVKPWKLP
eukprot:2481301-Pyramimonas_sp.AAC.1